MIQVWIILHGQNYVDKNKWLSPAYLPGENVRQPRISSDPLNLKILVVHTVHIETFLLQQVINMWNDISYEIKSSGNLTFSKNKFDNWRHNLS